MPGRSSCDEQLLSLLSQRFRDFFSLLAAQFTNVLEPRDKLCLITAEHLTTERRQENENTIGEPREEETGAQSEVRHHSSRQLYTLFILISPNGGLTISLPCRRIGQRCAGREGRVNSYHEVSHKLDGAVDVCLFQLLCGFGSNARDVRQLCYVLEGRALEVRILLSCGGGHVH